MWYLDCYCYAASNGVEKPVNGYSCEDPVPLVKIAQELLTRKTSGIDEVRICESTKAENVRPIRTRQEEIIDWLKQGSPVEVPPEVIAIVTREPLPKMGDL